MWLIAESGSTKTDWVLMNNEDEEIGHYETSGLNPTFLKENSISNVILRKEELNSIKSSVSEVYFFGAGVSSDRLKKIVLKGLRKIFAKASIYIDHDLTASAFSSYQGEPCISCIIGTGSNSIFFDGENFRKEVPSLAHILGDEASGTYFSKELVRAYFYKKLPVELREKFEERFGVLDKDEVIERVYEMESPNMYLASFMPFIIDHKDHPFFQPIIKEGINEFLDIHVKCYNESDTVETHFVGSVASLLREEIKQVGQEMNLKIGSFIDRPVVRLKKYLIRERKRLSPQKQK